MASKPNLRSFPDADQAEETIAEQWVSAATISSERVNWLWPQLIVGNALAIVEGDKGVGKTTLLAAIVAAVTNGTKLLGRRKGPLASALWLAGEVPYDSFVTPRLIAAGADMSRVQYPAKDSRGFRRRLILPNQVGLLEKTITHFGAKVAVIDPLASFTSPESDLRSDQSTHQTLDPLIDLAGATGCAIILSRHLSKDRSGPRICQGLGGAAVGGAAQSVLAIDWPDRKSARRILRAVACNPARELLCMEYSLKDQGGAPVMHATRWLSAEEDDEEGNQLDVGERDVRGDARRLLRLVIGKEWISVPSILKEAQNASISERTLRTAKAELKIPTRPNRRSVPRCWEWGPPKGGWKEEG